MTAIRHGRLATAILIVAALAGCTSSRPQPATAGHSAPSASLPASLPASAPAPASVSATTTDTAARLDAARTNVLMVLDDFERDGAAVKTGQPKKDRGDDMTAYYADHAALTGIHGGGGISAPISCGKAAGQSVIDGAIVGTPTSAGGAITLPVTLYIGPTPAANLTVSADDAGKLTGVSCLPPTAPNLPGAAALSGYYGGASALATDPQADDKTSALKDRFLAPAFAKFTRPDVEADQSECSEDTMAYWHAAYDPQATTTGAQWYFNAGGGGQVNMSVAVDAAASRVAWVYCFGQLTPPLTAGGAYSDSQVQSYVDTLFNDYAYLQALKPFGADTSGMRAYFASDAAYQAALAGTGAQPLECSATAATSIGADSVTVTGATDVVDLTSSPAGHPVTVGALGHPKVTVDTATMRITSVACV